jgi:hypothetical protein
MEIVGSFHGALPWRGGLLLCLSRANVIRLAGLSGQAMPSSADYLLTFWTLALAMAHCLFFFGDLHEFMICIHFGKHSSD